MKLTPLTASQRQVLLDAVGCDYSLKFLEHFNDRLAVGTLLWQNAYIRLTCPEAYLVHRDIIEWNVRFSNDKIPEEAVGVGRATAILMRWVMGSWKRVEFFNRYLFGTIPPRVQLDFIPALACSAHVLLQPRAPLATVLDYVKAGVALQRLWLASTSVGLQLQPEMTPVIFRWYARAGRDLSADPSINQRTEVLAAAFERVAGLHREEEIAFFCRVGVSPQPRSRSLRKAVAELMKR